MPESKRTHWKALAAASYPSIPEPDLSNAEAALDELEGALQALNERMPSGTLMWVSPEEVE